MLSSETHLRCKNKCKLKVKEYKIILQANYCQAKVGIEVPISDKIDLEINKVMREK